MKKTLFTLLLCSLVYLTSWGQLTEGAVKYEMEMVGDDPQIQMAKQMFGEMNMIISFAKQGVRTDINMGSFMQLNNIFNYDENKGVVLTSSMMGKKAAMLEEEDMNAQMDESAYTFEFESTNETRKIQGYNCQKYIARTADGQEFSYWLTDDIQPTASLPGNFRTQGKGFPLEMEGSNNGMTIRYVAKEITKKLENKTELFSTAIPAGYEITDFETLNGGQ